jgi:hypothetical protein
MRGYMPCKLRLSRRQEAKMAHIANPEHGLKASSLIPVNRLQQKSIEQQTLEVLQRIEGLVQKLLNEKRKGK